MTSNRLQGLEKELKFRKRVMRWANAFVVFITFEVALLFWRAFAGPSVKPILLTMGVMLLFAALVALPPWYLCMRANLSMAKSNFKEFLEHG